MAAPQHKMHTKATSLSSGKNTSPIIRRSERLRHVTPTAQNQETEPVVEEATKRHIESDSPAANLNYKSMYIDSQKKIEALTSENFELSKKLEVALGKLEAVLFQFPPLL
ncbi:hypothetical protein Acr_17g0002730 [Actinidia rufa]|uniref:Uncharacterized protein n=1 Tax=Actinidia rufa TaxID=165716 RepID=A0A7J0G1P3_9ERIC|nr:hypothetical protein Acr_17g0002730 [Actinidia rufa]